jgi:hypothetical protein
MLVEYVFISIMIRINAYLGYTYTGLYIQSILYVFIRISIQEYIYKVYYTY